MVPCIFSRDSKGENLLPGVIDIGTYCCDHPKESSPLDEQQKKQLDIYKYVQVDGENARNFSFCIL